MNGAGPLRDLLDERADVPAANLGRPHGAPRGEELVVDDAAVFLPRALLHAGVLLDVEVGQILEGRRQTGIPARLRRVTIAGDFADHLPGSPPRIG